MLPFLLMFYKDPTVASINKLYGVISFVLQNCNIFITWTKNFFGILGIYFMKLVHKYLKWKRPVVTPKKHFWFFASWNLESINCVVHSRNIVQNVLQLTIKLCLTNFSSTYFSWLKWCSLSHQIVLGYLKTAVDRLVE